MTDIELARATADGDAVAMAAFEAGPLADARGHLVALGFAASAIDEAIQRARTKLVVDKALSAYRGRGSLAAFVRTTAVRLAIDGHREIAKTTEISELLAAPCLDPELEYMRSLYATELVAATKHAWSRLAAHERFVLSLRVFEQMSIDDIARVYGVHRANAARKTAAARASLIAHVRTSLRERLSIGESTLDSILRIVTTSVQLPVDEPFER